MDVDRIVHIRKIIHLECSAKVVYERIFRNSGGDRAGRCDDSPAEIQNKLNLFKKKELFRFLVIIKIKELKLKKYILEWVTQQKISAHACKIELGKTEKNEK